MDEEHEDEGLRKVASFGSFLTAGARAPAAGRFQGLLDGMESGDDSEALISVQELSNLLLHAANEEALRGLDAGRCVSSLMGLLQFEHNGEIMLLAVRCLSGLMEALPNSVGTVVAGGAVPQLCQKLLMITYVDVAEECIRALHRLAQEAPAPVLQGGALMAVLAYLDFFAVAVQRRAVEAAALMVRGARRETREQVEAGLESLTGLLGYADPQVAAGAADALATLSEAWAGEPALLEVLAQNGRLPLALLRVEPQTPHWSRAARCLGRLCSASPRVLRDALEAGLAGHVEMWYAPERAADVLFLCEELFAPLQTDWVPPSLQPAIVGAQLQQQQRQRRLRRAIRREERARRGEDGNDDGQEEEEEEEDHEEGREQEPTLAIDGREVLMREEEALYANVLAAVLPVLIRMHGEAAGGHAGRQRVVAGVARAVRGASMGQLEDRGAELAGLLAAVLRSSTPQALPEQALALKVCRHGLEMGGPGWAAALRRQGVAHAVQSLMPRLVGAGPDVSWAAEQGRALLDLFGDFRAQETPEQRALTACCGRLDTDLEAASELCTLLAGGPSAWELQTAGLSTAVAGLNSEAAQRLWQALQKSGTAAVLVDGLLATLPVPEEGGVSVAEAGMSLKLFTQALAVEFVARPGAPAWPDNGGAAVEPLTTMARLSAWMAERMEQVARRAAVAEQRAAAAAKNEEEGGGGDEDDDNDEDDDDDDEQVRDMEPDEFRDHMTNLLHDLSGLEPEERLQGMHRLKRQVEAFARAQGSVPQLDEDDVEGAPEEEARQLQATTSAAQQAVAERIAARPHFRFAVGTYTATQQQTLYAVASAALNVRGRALWSAAPIRVEYWQVEENAVASAGDEEEEEVVAAAARATESFPLDVAENALKVLHAQVTKHDATAVRFVSTRLTAALEAALCDPLASAAGALPSWAPAVARRSPWLLPLVARKELMEKSAFGALRALADLRIVTGGGGGRGGYSGEGGQFQFGRMPRAKVRVQRQHVWETARAVLSLNGALRSQLEVEFCAEVGTGLGPTLEVFVLC